MLCTNCQSREANFHYKQVINGKHTELNLCTECARELGYLNQGEGMFDLSSFFGDFLSMPSFAPSVTKVMACPDCATTFDEFKRAILDEKYEDAAVLRDKIKKIEEEKDNG